MKGVKCILVILCLAVIYGCATGSRSTTTDPSKKAISYFEKGVALSSEGKPEYVILRQNETAFVESCGVCIFPYMLIEEGIELIAEFYSAATGIHHSEADVRRLGERIFNLDRMFNLKAGLTSKDDTLPKRFLEEPMPDGPKKGQVVELDQMLPEYYKLRSWDENGVPTLEKLKELGLEKFA